MILVYLDLETYLIRPGNLAPKPVCFQYAIEDEPVVITQAKKRNVEKIIELFRLRSIFIGQNIAFDMLVLYRHFPQLRKLIWGAYINNRVRDTKIRQKLIDIAHGDAKKHKNYSLEEIAARYGFEKDSNDPWRLRYSELAGVPIKDWPEAAIEYAKKDVEVTRAVYKAQMNPADEIPQTRYAWTMHVLGANGIHTDPKVVEKLIKTKKDQHVKDFKDLHDQGFVRKDGSRNTKPVKEYVTKIYEGSPPLTKKTKSVSLSEETLLESGDPILITYQRYGSHKGLLKRLERLKKGYETPLNPQFQPIVETGRTACRQGRDTDPVYGFQVHNVPYDMREAFTAGRGNCFVTADYCLAELHTLAQICYWLFGETELGKALNDGVDVHCRTAAEYSGLPYEQILKRKKIKGSPEAQYRAVAKAANFGLPGGMGWERLRRKIKKDAGIDLSPHKVRELKRAWLQTYPEMNRYFRYIREGLHWVHDYTRITQFVSNRVRGGVKYTEACNSFFQGLAADMAKNAMFWIHHDCEHDELKGWIPWNFVHDEACLRGPIEGEVYPEDALNRVIYVMERSGKEYVPDFPPKAEGEVALKWRKF